MTSISYWSTRTKLLAAILVATVIAGIVALFIPHSATTSPPRGPTPQFSADPGVATGSSSSPLSTSSNRANATPGAAKTPAQPFTQLPVTADSLTYASQVALRLSYVNYATMSRDAVINYWKQTLATVPFAVGDTQSDVAKDQQQAMALLTTDGYILSETDWASSQRLAAIDTFRVLAVGRSPASYVDPTLPGYAIVRVSGILTITSAVPGSTARNSADTPIQIDLAVIGPPTQSDGVRLIAPVARSSGS